MAASSHPVRVVTATLTPAAIGGNNTAEQTFAVLGARIEDQVRVSKPTAQAGIGIVGCRVAAPDSVSITFLARHPDGDPLTPTAGQVYTFAFIAA